LSFFDLESSQTGAEEPQAQSYEKRHQRQFEHTNQKEDVRVVEIIWMLDWSSHAPNETLAAGGSFTDLHVKWCSLSVKTYDSNHFLDFSEANSSL
jgi:hypothetical protein